MKSTLAVTIDDELLIKLKKMAAEENRKLSNLVETLLYRALDSSE